MPSLPHKFNLKLVIIASIQWSECECALIPQLMCPGFEADEIEYYVDTDTGIVIERKDTTFPCLGLFVSPMILKCLQNLAISSNFCEFALESIL